MTVPSSFADEQRVALRNAASTVGLTVLRVINEEVAAVLSYTHTLGQDTDTGTVTNTNMPDESLVVVIHLGGFTTTASLLGKLRTQIMQIMQIMLSCVIY